MTSKSRRFDFFLAMLNAASSHCNQLSDATSFVQAVALYQRSGVLRNSASS